MIPPDLVSPLTSELGIGGLGGFCVGYSLKKVAKIVSVMIAIGLLALQYFAQKRVVMINYIALEEWAMRMLGGTSALQGFFVTLVAQVPFGIGFAGGVYLGLKKG
jgi:uncharacterized membrane protein (Fun14 family)